MLVVGLALLPLGCSFYGRRRYPREVALIREGY
jgi:hypothetical protein